MFSIKNQSLRLRKCQSSDYRFCHDISKRAMAPYFDKYFGGWDSKIFKKNFKISQISIIEYKQRRIGLYAREIKDDYLHILNIQVSGNFQGKGIGSFILAQLEKKAKEKKLKKLSLQVFKGNPAIKLYKKTGFKPIKTKNRSVFMEKNLNNPNV
jgi:ribosomal protein S18 acetylase RimI-like enzyme